MHACCETPEVYNILEINGIIINIYYYVLGVGCSFGPSTKIAGGENSSRNYRMMLTKILKLINQILIIKILLMIQKKKISQKRKMSQKKKMIWKKQLAHILKLMN